MRINKFVLLSCFICASALVSCGPKVVVTSENESQGTVSYFNKDNKLAMQAYPKDGYRFSMWLKKDNDDGVYRFASASNPYIVEYKNDVTFQAVFEETSTQTFNFIQNNDDKGIPVSYSISNFYGVGINEVVIPNTHFGLPVIEIKDDTFAGFSNITSIKIPQNIIYIRDDAFKNCTGIKEIVIDHEIKVFGSAFDGWGEYEVGKHQTIKIPSSCIKESESKYKTTWLWNLTKIDENCYTSSDCGSTDAYIVGF